jgi:vacuolar protein-sorting-associated protein 4
VPRLKYEKNPAAKERIKEKVIGYMQRAEFLKDALSGNNAGKSGGGGGGAATASKSEGKDKEDDESKKMRANLSSAIVSEKPNIKWDDVAGLEMAKDALKEAVILPIRNSAASIPRSHPYQVFLNFSLGSESLGRESFSMVL